MDIPLKSQPKVSMVSLLDESKFTLGPYDGNDIEYDENEVEYENESNEIGSQRRHRNGENSSENIGLINEIIKEKKDNNYSLSRLQIKTDGNREAITSPLEENRRKLRTRTHSPDSEHSPMSPNNENSGYGEYLSGLEDEYIPGLNFGDMVFKWNRPSDQNLSRYDETVSTSTSTSTSNTPLSRDASYLDLNKLHAKVSPQPIALRGQLNNNNKYSYSKLSDFMKASRAPKSISTTAPVTANKDANNSTSTLTSTIDSDHKKRRLKSSQIVDPNTGDINYELILSSLPPNFNDLPYSQRKRVVKSFSESIDYSQFSLFAKQYLTDKLPSSSGKTPGSGSNNGSFRRSRHNSTNTVAGRLLALSSSSSSDLKKMEEGQQKKNNVDEKGAMVMGYELGKIIGFGAWGTIRECCGKGGVIKAVKIVKSSRNIDSASAPSLSLDSKTSPTHSRPPQHNPKVLEVFRKEINIWKQLKHENILPLIDHLETDTAIFCITNRIFGGTLFELVSSWGIYNFGMQNMSGPVSFLIENQRIRLSQTKTFIKQIISALSYLHEEMGVVHGDLKLENALVDDRNKDDLKVILCDFGMSRVYTSRVSKKSSFLSPTQNSPSSTIRSKSSTTDLRKPYLGGATKNTRNLFTDDSKIGMDNLFKHLGPSLQSVDLTPEHSHHSLYQFHENSNKPEGKIDSGLPHSHIGSLPYASPELLSPSPPPLGPSADIWALGVLMYTMCTGKLPFQHPYEPTLRSIITSGDYNKTDLKKACLLQWILADDLDSESESNSITDSGAEVEKSERLTKSDKRSKSMFSSSLVDNKREREIEELHDQWLQYNKSEFSWLFDIIKGSLQANITKRWDLNKIYESVHVC
mmetsp:Transcript_9117/g.9012  ORF Transcript_9117/g.9012 Transcript_9117/m.9012 type:complete len:861 (-) Transcript_9117:308-2890(-)